MPYVGSLAGARVAHHRSPNIGGTMAAHHGVVMHTAVGSYHGTIGWQLNPEQRYANGTRVRTSSTWIIGKVRGEIAQMVDTNVIAWCQRNGSLTWNSIEFAGRPSEPLTAWQIEAAADILTWMHLTYKVPIQIANNPSERGLGHHSMDRETWGEEWGHDDCPGKLIIAQKPLIVARAKQILNGGTDMAVTPEDARAIATAVWGHVIGSGTLGVTKPAGDWIKSGVGAERAVAAMQSTLLAKLAELAEQDDPDAPPGTITLEMATQAVKTGLREVLSDAVTPDDAPSG